jgi:hypothetical protein
MVLSDFRFNEGVLLSLDMCKRLCATARHDWVLLLLTALHVAHDLTEVVTLFGFNSMCCSLNW